MDRNHDLNGLDALWQLQSLGFVVDRIERRDSVRLKITGIGAPPADLVAALQADRDAVLEHIRAHNQMLDRHERTARGFLRVLGDAR